MAPRWIVVRLGDDLNWWVEQTSGEISTEPQARGILDPRQVEQLTMDLAKLEPHGLNPDLVDSAFHCYEVEAEASPNRLRLGATCSRLTHHHGQVFALPVMDEEDTGPYLDFLDAISAAQICLLNATHHYARDCTELDMTEELEALDHDRYFSRETMHVFSEISEILQWSPAEWDGAGDSFSADGS